MFILIICRSLSPICCNPTPLPYLLNLVSFSFLLSPSSSFVLTIYYGICIFPLACGWHIITQKTHSSSHSIYQLPSVSLWALELPFQFHSLGWGFIWGDLAWVLCVLSQMLCNYLVQFENPLFLFCFILFCSPPLPPGSCSLFSLSSITISILWEKGVWWWCHT